MPFYRYECEKCGHEFRILQPTLANDDASCPSCESADVRRLLSRVSVQFKGSGYYKTDRANKKSKAGTRGANDKAASSEASSGESKDSRESKDSSDSREPKDSSDSKNSKDSRESKSDTSGKSDKSSRRD